MRIFHGIVNYGTQAGLLSKGLKEIGYEAISVSKYDKYKRPIDVELKFGGNIFQKSIRYIKNIGFLIRCFFKFDIFHFYFGKTLLPKQLDLYFYKFFNKKVVMHYLGNDVELYDWSKKNYEITNMAEMMTEREGKIHDKKILKRMTFERRFIDQTLVCAPQYSPFVKDSIVVPLAVDLKQFKYSPLPEKINGVIRILHAPTSRKKKGTEFLIAAVDKLLSEGYKVQLDLCENITHEELTERYKKCHFSVVALMGGWYGTAGIEAMAIGRPIISFIRDSLFQYTHLSKEDLPIISAHKNNIYDILKLVLDEHYNLETLSKKSYEFAHKEHDYKMISTRVVDIYKNLKD